MSEKIIKITILLLLISVVKAYSNSYQIVDLVCTSPTHMASGDTDVASKIVINQCDGGVWYGAYTRSSDYYGVAQCTWRVQERNSSGDAIGSPFGGSNASMYLSVDVSPEGYNSVACPLCPSGSKINELNPSGACILDCPAGKISINGVCEDCPTGQKIGNHIYDPGSESCAPWCGYNINSGPPGFIGADNCVEPQCGAGEVILPPSNICESNCDYPQIVGDATGVCYTPDCAAGEQRLTPSSPCTAIPPTCGPCQIVNQDNQCQDPPACDPIGYIRQDTDCTCKPPPCADGYERTTPDGPCVQKCAEGFERLTPDAQCIPKCQYPMVRGVDGGCVNTETGCPPREHKNIEGNCVGDDTTVDDDNDGTPDIDDPDHAYNQPDADPDNDGTPNATDPDDDGDGTPDVNDYDHPTRRPWGDFDNDGLTNDEDPDDDNDGVDDPDDPDADTDNDGERNDEDKDIDGDGTPNAIDPDAQGNGVPDTEEPPKPISCPEGTKLSGDSCVSIELLPEYEETSLGQEGSYNDRYFAMVQNIRKHEIFGLVSGVGDIPSGSSIATIDMGRLGGEQSINYADYDDVWSTLRAVFLIICSWVGLKIITKGGG